jgi:hypothetical protein
MDLQAKHLRQTRSYVIDNSHERREIRSSCRPREPEVGENHLLTPAILPSESASGLVRHSPDVSEFAAIHRLTSICQRHVSAWRGPRNDAAIALGIANDTARHFALLQGLEGRIDLLQTIGAADELVEF